jgi:hypothetical protein
MQGLSRADHSQKTADLQGDRKLILGFPSAKLAENTTGFLRCVNLAKAGMGG